MRASVKPCSVSILTILLTLITGAPSEADDAKAVPSDSKPAFFVFDAYGYDRANDESARRRSKGPDFSDHAFPITEHSRMRKLYPSDGKCVSQTMNTLLHSPQFMRLAPFLDEVTIAPTAPESIWRHGSKNGFEERSLKTKRKFFGVIPLRRTEHLGFSIEYFSKTMAIHVRDCRKAQLYLDQEIGKVYLEKSQELAKAAAESDQREYVQQLIKKMKAALNAVNPINNLHEARAPESGKKSVDLPAAKVLTTGVQDPAEKAVVGR